MSVNYSKPKLVSFYIFDSRNGQKEGEEHEKLLYYSPSEEHLNAKVRNVGLSEAFTRFTSMFNKSSDCETVRSQKHITALIQPEPFIWMVLKIALAHTCQRADQQTSKKSRSSKKSLKSSKSTKSTPVSNSAQSQGSSDPTPVPGDGDRRGSQQTAAGNLTVDFSQSDGGSSSPRNDSADRTSLASSVSNASSGEALDVSKNTTNSNFSVLREGGAENSGAESKAIGATDASRHESLNSTSTVLNSHKNSDGENYASSSSRATKEDSDSLESQTDVHSSSTSLPTKLKNCVSKNSQVQSACSNPDCASTVQYLSTSVQPSVLQAHLRAAYASFALLHHSFDMVLRSQGLEKLRHVLEHFFDDYLAKVDMSHGDMSSVWRGLSYLPLSQSLLLRVRCCLASLRSALPAVRAAAFLYSGSVAWCDFDLETLRRLLHYLHYSGVLKQAALQSTQQEAGYANRFIGGVGHSVRAYVGEDGRAGVAGRRSECHLLLYSCAGTLLPLVVPVTERLEPVLYEKLARLMDSRVTQLVTDIIASKPPKSTPNYNDNLNYIYHNSMNLAVKSTLRVEKPPEHSLAIDSASQGGGKSGWWFSGNKTTDAESSANVVESGAFGLGGGMVFVTSSQGPSVIPWKVMLTIVDLQADMQRYGHHESVLKTVDDYWVVGRMGNGRQLFVTLANSTSNLVEITDEVQRIAQLHFSDIFMLE